MKSLLFAFAVVIAATAACNSAPSATGCVTAACGGNTSTYQACDQGGGSVQYSFGSTSCTCTPANPLSCVTCRSSLATYCGVVIGGSSSSGGSSGSSSGSSSGGAPDATTGDAGGADGPEGDAEENEGSTVEDGSTTDSSGGGDGGGATDGGSGG